MKKTILASGIFLLITLSMVSQGLEWSIVKHSSDLTVLREEVQGRIDDGYMPMGMSYYNENVYMLYGYAEGADVLAWGIDAYQSSDSMEDQIKHKMAGGFLPSAISFTGDSFLVLYLLSESLCTQYDIALLSPDSGDYKEKLDSLIDKGFLIQGLTSFGQNDVFLSVKPQSSSYSKWLVAEIPSPDDFEKIIQRYLAEGLIPWGFDFSARKVRILLIG